MTSIRTRAAAAALCLAMTAGVAAAVAAAPENEPASFGARDPATTKCSLVTRMQEKGGAGTELQFYTWAQAWFAGRLAENPNAGKKPLDASGPGRSKAYETLLEFCEKNPDARFGQAVEALWASS